MKIDESVYLAEGSIVRGDITLEEGVSIWYNTVLRGDINSITIKKGSNIQDLCVLHVDYTHPIVIGEGVTVGHGAILHGCIIGENTLIGMGSIILDGAVIGKNCLIGAGAMVTQGKHIPDGSVVLGSPGKVVREIREEELFVTRESARIYMEEARECKAKS